MGTNECYVYFAIDGDELNPDEITKIIGIKPTSIMRKGSRIPNMVPKSNSWKLSTPKIVNEVIDVEKMTLQVISPLQEKIEIINDIRKKFNATTRLEVVMWITTDDSQSTPAIGFDVEIMKFLVAVGAFIDIDIYRNIS